MSCLNENARRLAGLLLSSELIVAGVSRVSAEPFISCIRSYQAAITKADNLRSQKGDAESFDRLRSCDEPERKIELNEESVRSEEYLKLWCA
jgi:hypothetical protein